MAVALRLKRVGMLKQPYYRVVAVDSHRAAQGSEIEVLGHYDPRHEANSFNINADRVQYWISCGAQVSDTVRTLLVNKGVLQAPGQKTQS